VKGLYRPLRPIQKVVRLIIGYLHLVAAIAWFGAIFYVHILLKLAYAAKGLPRGELILGCVGIILLTITGVLLTISDPNLENVLYYKIRSIIEHKDTPVHDDGGLGSDRDLCHRA
jgi:hypothetical protein